LLTYLINLAKKNDCKNIMKTVSKVILGIDPGTVIMGYGVIEIIEKKPYAVVIGDVKMAKLSDHYVKLKHIFDRVTKLIDEYHPDELAIESPFMGKNAQVAIKLGRAQGAAIAAALQRSIPIFEYAPRKIKMSITGTGTASKEQVAGLLQNILKLKELPVNLDATDGLAVALCHYYQTINGVVFSSGAKNWEDFIKKNPSRVKK